MTNYEAIFKMIPEYMERFLDQVYLTGLNTGMYAAKHDDDSVLDDNPFNATWLSEQAEAATALGVAEDGDAYILTALTKAILRSAGIPTADDTEASINPATIKVTAVKPLPNHKLWLRFNTGEEKVFDFTPLLVYPAFAPLVDSEEFNAVSLDHGVTVWKNGKIDIAPSYLYDPVAYKNHFFELLT